MEMKNRAVCDELSKQLIDKWAGFIEDRDPIAFMEKMMTNESFVYALSVWGNALSFSVLLCQCLAQQLIGITLSSVRLSVLQTICLFGSYMYMLYVPAIKGTLIVILSFNPVKICLLLGHTIYKYSSVGSHASLSKPPQVRCSHKKNLLLK